MHNVYLKHELLNLKTMSGSKRILYHCVFAYGWMILRLFMTLSTAFKNDRNTNEKELIHYHFISFLYGDETGGHKTEL